jgi:hypothetical protein
VFLPRMKNLSLGRVALITVLLIFHKSVANTTNKLEVSSFCVYAHFKTNGNSTINFLYYILLVYTTDLKEENHVNEATGVNKKKSIRRGDEDESQWAVNSIDDRQRSLLCASDGWFCIPNLTCQRCCNTATFWITAYACGSMPCREKGRVCVPGVTCKFCCNGHSGVVCN